MKNTLVAFFSVIFLLTIKLYAQTESAVLFLPNINLQGQLSWNGYSSISGDAGSINTLNPAAMHNFKNISAGINYRFETKLNDAWIAGITSERMKPAIPQSAGIIIPYGDFRFGLSMAQLYNRDLDFGPLILTDYSGAETGRADLYMETTFFRYTAALSYCFRDFLSGSFILGAGLNYNKIHEYQEMYYFYGDKDIDVLTFSAGLIYQAETENGTLKTGISYESGIKEKEHFGRHYRIDNVDLFYSVISCNYPARINAGFYFDSNGNLSYAGNLNLILWSDVNQFNNEPQASGSVIYRFSEMYSGSAGILFSSVTEKETGPGFDYKFKLSAFYITAGVNIKLPLIDISAALADSHLTGGEWRKQTIAKISFGYSF
jgi:hypothetical protein